MEEMTARKHTPGPDELRMHRTTGYISRVLGDRFNLVVPAWNYRTCVRIQRTEFPENLRQLVARGTHLSFYCNIRAQRRNDLRFEQWELAAKPASSNPSI